MSQLDNGTWGISIKYHMGDSIIILSFQKGLGREMIAIDTRLKQVQFFIVAHKMESSFIQKTLFHR